MTKAEATYFLEKCRYWFMPYTSEEDIWNEALDMAIEALSKPNYETDTEVRLAVTDRNKDKVVLWDAFGEVEYYPNGEINCVHCPHYYETEDDTGVHSHCGSHGRLIDADALALDKIRWRLCLGLDCSLCPFYRNENCGVWEMIENAPTVQADRPHGEWIFNPKDAIELMFTKPKCSKCGFESADGGNFCPNCGADMRGDNNGNSNS